MGFDARRYTVDSLIKQLLLLELHVRDGSVYECGCSWDAHLPLIEGLAEEGNKFAMSEQEKKFFDWLMHLARDARLKLQYGIEGEKGMEVEGEHHSLTEKQLLEKPFLQWTKADVEGYTDTELDNIMKKQLKEKLKMAGEGEHHSNPEKRCTNCGWAIIIERGWYCNKLGRDLPEPHKGCSCEGCEFWKKRSSNPVGITGESERFIHETLQEKEVCDPRSFRTVRQDEHRIVVCCPKREWDETLSEGQQCRVGTVAQKILHPIWEKGEHASES